MCGIAGLAGPGSARHEDTVVRMGRSQSHRGPDGTRHTTAVDGHAVLAMNSLRIVDAEADFGPYVHPGTGLALTFNGEIYNYRAVAASWDIPLAPGETDAHLVLRIWARLGPAALDLLDGMFALAVYDPRDQKLFLARDRLGEKPLYWRTEGTALAFASEVSALLGFGPAPVVVRPEMLAVETPLGVTTPFEGIQLLAPATVLAFDITTGDVDQHAWWCLEDVHPWAGDGEDYNAALDTFSGTLTEQVPARVPRGDFALLLSGGLDSCLLAYLMRPPVCVTVRYPGQDRLDESAIAATVAQDIGAELVIVEPGIDDLRSALPHITTALDYPMGNASTLSEYMAYRAVADLGIRVVVGGLGPDEFLMGYARHAFSLFGPDASLAAGLEAYRPLAAKLFHPADEPLQPAEKMTRLILRGPDPDGRIHDLAADALRRADGDLSRALTLTELATAWRPLVMTSDKLASAFSLERRSPYLAQDLVELAYQLPAHFKIRHPAEGKRILRDTARALGLPREIWNSREKLGFASPVPTWLTGPLASWADYQIRAALADAPAALRPLLQGGLTHRGRWDRTRMQALMAAAWLADQPVPASA
ncbi:asparagine synthase (glutamine-hydrolyzing) [Streptomyces umbrinus]|uniref:asparagine synthase (glutamine-hydrolyzing) n=2 Tax=Streptomyces umbrinus TaxID=67370 RepID=A0ABU0T6V7_9ACTN|nr:asparagine synthase (glutamine-hydrolyzing) [Streptomyces umbrinus]